MHRLTKYKENDINIQGYKLPFLVGVLGEELCRKEEHFYVLESDIEIIGLSRNGISNKKVVAASLLSPKMHKRTKYKENAFITAKK